MLFTFSRNPIDKLYCWWENKKEKIAHKKWNKKHYRVKCFICDDILDSEKTEYSPEECGWRQLKGMYKVWICHRCIGHRYFVPFIKQIDEYEAEQWKKILDKK